MDFIMSQMVMMIYVINRKNFKLKLIQMNGKPLIVEKKKFLL